MAENKKDIAWDLSQVFPNIDDPSINKTLEKLSEKVTSLERKYKGNITSLDALGLQELLQDFEDYLKDQQEIRIYANLSYAANMIDAKIQSLRDRANKLGAEWQKKLAFLDLEIGKLVFDKPEYIEDPLLAQFKHYLECLYREVPHLLSEIEEQLVIEKDQYGINAWAELQGKWLNTRKFEVEIEGEKKNLSYGEANGLLHHPDRATRESANKSIYTLLGKDGSDIFAAALRSICNDWVNITKRRKYDSELHGSLIANDTEDEIIESLMKAIDEGSTVYRRYLKIKARLLNLPKLKHYDVVAPISSSSGTTYSWESAKELVLNAYKQFSPTFAQYTEDMYKRNNIDASPRYGKRNGAFCTSWYKGKSAYMLQSFNGSLADIYTLGHEIGHAIHAYFISRNQNILNSLTPMVVAETASTFGELLLTDLLLKKASKEEKIAILCHVLDDAGQAAFQVSARKWFEQDLYDAINRGEYLDYKTICNYWTKNRDRIYADAVEFEDEFMESEWTMKGHYYIPNFRFYNYPYVYAQLFVYALYQKYIDEGPGMVPKFEKALATGSSKSPKEIAEIFGLDVTDPEFWKLGIKRYESFVNQLEELLIEQ
ncbi:MAG: hypothetical protein EU530_09175 [Promethearchaeota archaeon]|nr:MAG: hypothetical protein EU530_09175 [Candidatus Lokiarchaeota archaeon]